jgi:murein DD-endopeptidase MepM/ murein hydrolase activator NlpD
MLNNKNNNNLILLFTKKSKSNIYIRRVEFSKKFLTSTVFSLVFSIAIISVGIFQISKNADFDQLNASNKTNSINPQTALSDYRTINYERPINGDFTNNAGGPDEFQLTNESDAEENAIEQQLRAIELSSNPEFIPSMWSHLGKINNEFGFRRNPFGGSRYEFHAGMDIDGERGDVVVAPANGVIVKAGYQGGYGNMIEVDHGNGLTTRYGHLSKIEIQVGDTVNRGQIIGFVGSTGRSTGPHLHYELRLNDKAINPRRFLPPEPSEIKTAE